jgi:hypothetical protein
MRGVRALGRLSPLAIVAALPAVAVFAADRPAFGVGIVLGGPSVPAARHVGLVFGPASDRARPSGGLGSIWFDEDGNPGQTLTVDDVAVRARVSQTRVNGRALEAWPPALADQITARALGRVLAHEIGHYLLASPAHTRIGVMRATFNGRHLTEWDRGDFDLDREAIPRLRARLARLQIRQLPTLATIQPVP